MGDVCWARWPVSGKGYEVSSLGDRRFSAFFARLDDGRTIEQHYQCDVKGYDAGGTNWRLGKGKPPKVKIDPDALYQKYLELWTVWAQLNEPLFLELVELAISHDHCLTDRFAKTSINQAAALADLINSYLETRND
jgi:hypothetical protein